MRGEPSISSIYQRGESSTQPDPDRQHAKMWRLYRDLWTQQDTIVFKVRDLPDDLREPLIKLANDTYGEQQHGKR